MTETGTDPRRLSLVSVVIPVYNDADRLATCLRALEEQSYPGDRLEILVVDNGSDDNVADVVAGFERARLLMEPRPGSYAARNCGVRESRGEIIAFTDADCVPSPDWIERGVSHLVEDPTVGLVGGQIQVVAHDPGNPTGAELADIITSFQQRHFVEHLAFAATASAFTRKNVFGRVGPFDEQLMSGGDREWGERVARAGYLLRYAEDATVVHPARRSIRQLYERSKRLHAGARDQERFGKSNLFVGELLRSLVPPVRTAWRLRQDDRIPNRAAWVRAVAVLSMMRLTRGWFILRFALGGPSPRK